MGIKELALEVDIPLRSYDKNPHLCHVIFILARCTRLILRRTDINPL